MARGFLGGMLIGGLVSVGAAVILAILVEPPRPPEFAASLSDDVDTPEVPVATVGTVPGRDGDEPLRPATPQVTEPDPGADSALDGDATQPGPAPQAVELASDALKPAELPAAVAAPAAVATDTPVTSSRNVVQQIAPQPDAVAQVEITPPAARPLPAQIATLGAGAQLTAEPEQAPAPTVPGRYTGSPAAQSSAPVSLAQPSEPDAMDVSAPDRIASAPAQVQLAPPVIANPAPQDTGDAGVSSAAPDVQRTAAAQAPAQPGVIAPQDNQVTSAVQDPGAAGPSAQAPGLRGTANNAPRIAALGQSETAIARPMIGTPAKSLLARSGDALATPEQGVLPTITAPQPENSALVAHAETFENAEDKPLLSIVLMDSGFAIDDDTVGLPALRSFPHKLSIAVDWSLPDAADRAALYRSRGFEVLAMIDLPENLTASDTEVVLTAALDTVPEAVGVLEGPVTGLQGTPEMAAQVGEILSETGHGIIWRSKGLDTARKLAAKNGVASHTMFRDFDSSGQTPIVIRRFLDQAAFKAGQQGGLIMVGRLRTDTISALLVWGLQDRASRVAIAPVSAVLQVPQEPS
ncbi:divergent polysaccharide deacetylase family protein [Aliishimia ponticola]|nr:divergent polysaccharide deacetylase family protein [Aliishimia ponticola]